MIEPQPTPPPADLSRPAIGVARYVQALPPGRYFVELIAIPGSVRIVGVTTTESRPPGANCQGEGQGI